MMVEEVKTEKAGEVRSTTVGLLLQFGITTAKIAKKSNQSEDTVDY